MKTFASLIFAVLAVIAASAQAAEPIKLGFVMPLSGWFQPIDSNTVRGAKMAVEDINAAGGVLGRPLTVISFDNKSDPQLTADGATDVISQGATMILLPSDFDFGAAGAYVAQQQNVIAFSGASDPKFGSKTIGSLAFSDSTAGQAQGAMLADWAYNKKKWRNAYVLLDNTISVTKSFCGSFADRWKAIGKDAKMLGQDQFLNSDASVAPQRTRILSLPTKPDFIVLCSYPPGGPSVIRQLRTAGIKAPILSGEPMDGDFWIGSVPDLSNFYVMNFGSFYGDDTEKSVNDFFARYKAKYKIDKGLDARAVLGYTAVQAYAHAVAKAGTTDGAKVAAALDTFKSEPLLAGPTTYSPTLRIQTSRSMALLEAVDGKFHFVDRLTTDHADLKSY